MGLTFTTKTSRVTIKLAPHSVTKIKGRVCSGPVDGDWGFIATTDTRGRGEHQQGPPACALACGYRRSLSSPWGKVDSRCL